MNTLTTLRAVFARDLLLALRRKSDTLAAAIFFVIVVSLFPLGVGPEPELLRRLAPGVVWVGVDGVSAGRWSCSWRRPWRLA